MRNERKHHENQDDPALDHGNRGVCDPLAQAFLQKPFSARQLIETIDQVLAA